MEGATVAAGRWRATLAIACAIGVILSILVVSGGALSIDAPVDGALRDVDAPLVIDAARVLDALGGLEAVALVTILAVGFLLVRREPRAAAAFALAVLASELLVGAAKLAFGRARPEDGLLVAVTDSFPSGHAARAALLATLLAWLAIGRAGAKGRTRALVAAAAVGFALAMALSRMLLHVHYLTDVVAGAAAGVAVGALAIAAAGPRRVPASVSLVPEESPQAEGVAASPAMRR